jgi:hypothetical protein
VIHACSHDRWWAERTRRTLQQRAPLDPRLVLYIHQVAETCVTPMLALELIHMGCPEILHLYLLRYLPGKPTSGWKLAEHGVFRL